MMFLKIAASEWVDKIRDLVAKARGATLPPMRSAKEEKEDRGYTYSKPVYGRMYLVENAPKSYKVYKSKKHKLNKKGPSIVGRSNQVDITLNEEDVLVSRQHCKIVVEDNVPYLCDLGQCHHGTPAPLAFPSLNALFILPTFVSSSLILFSV